MVKLGNSLDLSLAMLANLFTTNTIKQFCHSTGILVTSALKSLDILETFCWNCVLWYLSLYSQLNSVYNKWPHNETFEAILVLCNLAELICKILFTKNFVLPIMPAIHKFFARRKFVTYSNCGSISNNLLYTSTWLRLFGWNHNHSSPLWCTGWWWTAPLTHPLLGSDDKIL